MIDAKQGYDLIGDIHGHANDLIELLKELDYENSEGFYKHTERKVIFLGDFIDRGVNQKRVLDIVMPMVEAGTALAVMGNHEFNALAFHTSDPENPAAWLRKRDDKNISQHLAFLNDYSSPELKNELNKVLSFFRSLPLWLEIEGIRVIHACWHDDIIQSICPMLNDDQTMTNDFFIAANRKDTIEYNAIEILLKGLEFKLPNSISFFDKDGHERHEVRMRWWLNEAENLGELAFGHYQKEITEIPVNKDQLIGYPDNAPPVFIGHYWLNDDKPKPLAQNIACIDYSVAKGKGGKLVAYRWNGETNLSVDNFIYVDHIK
tara:strand:+ start:16663 stop:17619 length:957 start_codon:yes stop_codon:yes gene_type:complete